MKILPRSTASRPILIIRHSDARSRLDDLRNLELEYELARIPGGRKRDGPEARRLQRQNHAERATLQSDRGGLQFSRKSKADARTATPDLAVLHKLRPCRCETLFGRKNPRLGDKSAACDALHAVQSKPACRRERPIPGIED